MQPVLGLDSGFVMKLPLIAMAPVERNRAGCRAFTLVEVIIAFGLSVLTYGYIMTANHSEWSAYSLAANSLALQRLEQARTCKWDTQTVPPTDELVTGNFPTMVNILDIPVTATTNSQNLAVKYATNFPVAMGNFSGLYTTIVASNVNFVYATNYTTITTLSTIPPLRHIRVDCVWNFMNGKRFTNTVFTYRGPDN
jgi:hypothetical protein